MAKVGEQRAVMVGKIVAPSMWAINGEGDIDGLYDSVGEYYIVLSFNTPLPSPGELIVLECADSEISTRWRIVDG